MINSILTHDQSNPWEFFTLLVSVTSLCIALVSLLLSRRHALRLFRVNQYPNFQFSFDIDVASNIAINGCYENIQRSVDIGSTNLPAMVVDWKNTTDKKAIDLRAEFILVGSRGSVLWEDFLDDWNEIDGLSHDRGVIGMRIGHAMACVGDNQVEIRENNSPLRELIGPGPYVAINSENPKLTNISFLLIVGFSWSPAIHNPPKQSSFYTFRIVPTKYDGVLVTKWKGERVKISRWHRMLYRFRAKKLNSLQ
ncbi:hypothetical protein ACQUQP_16975 [Marinobacterium sp. YM272]|uniref:hypothetical protein n=1 Tax=Marinobacterium sp. YM272 TaxID=3421654 RepID=UPI003D7F7168